MTCLISLLEAWQDSPSTKALNFVVTISCNIPAIQYNSEANQSILYSRVFSEQIESEVHISVHITLKTDGIEIDSWGIVEELFWS